MKTDKKNIDPIRENIELGKKIEHTNKNTLNGRQVFKILNAEEDYLPPSMPHDLRVAIAQARAAKGWNQEQFAKMIQVPKSDVNAWEAGKSAPSGPMIAKMDKILGVKLPRPPKN